MHCHSLSELKSRQFHYRLSCKHSAPRTLYVMSSSSVSVLYELRQKVPELEFDLSNCEQGPAGWSCHCVLTCPGSSQPLTTRGGPAAKKQEAMHLAAQAMLQFTAVEELRARSSHGLASKPHPKAGPSRRPATEEEEQPGPSVERPSKAVLHEVLVWSGAPTPPEYITQLPSGDGQQTFSCSVSAMLASGEWIEAGGGGTKKRSAETAAASELLKHPRLAACVEEWRARDTGKAAIQQLHELCQSQAWDMKWLYTPSFSTASSSAAASPSAASFSAAASPSAASVSAASSVTAPVLLWSAELLVNGVAMGSGQGGSKGEARVRAAEAAVATLTEKGGEPPQMPAGLGLKVLDPELIEGLSLEAFRVQAEEASKSSGDLLDFKTTVVSCILVTVSGGMMLNENGGGKKAC